METAKSKFHTSKHFTWVHLKFASVINYTTAWVVTPALPQICDMMSLKCLLICISSVHNGRQFLLWNIQRSTKLKITVILDHVHCLPTFRSTEQPFHNVLAIELRTKFVLRLRMVELLVEILNFLKKLAKHPWSTQQKIYHRTTKNTWIRFLLNRNFSRTVIVFINLLI